MTDTNQENLCTIKELIHGLCGAEITLEEAYQKGLIEQSDLLDVTAPLLRKDVARIVHVYLYSVLDEPDSTDITSSYILKDLYDCRVCTIHIMQVYTKGIMDSIKVLPSLHLFGLKEPVSKSELDDIFHRVFHKEARCIPMS